MDGDRLTDEEVALVLRRAADLDRELTVAGGLDSSILEDAAAEVGLSRQSVRRALAELRLGALEPVPARPANRSSRLLGPGTIMVRRSVPGPPQLLEAAVRQFLEKQLFRVRRDAGGRSTWAPRNDLRASVQRRVDRKVQRQLVLADVGGVQLAVAAEPGADPPRSLVCVELDVGQIRRSHGNAVVAGGLLGGAALAGSIVMAGLDPVTAATIPAGVAAVVAGHRLGARQYRQRVGAIETSVEGMLDDLERRAGAGGLPAGPPAR